MLVAENISYQVSGISLLSDVSVNMQMGELSVILGPNGAGKSTLIKNLSGEYKCTEGEVFVDKIALNEWNNALLASRRSVVTQFNSVNFPFSVSEIVMMGLLHSANESDYDQQITQVEKIMDELDVLDLQQRQYSTLSGGEQQRVAIARALVQVMHAANEDQSCYLLLDEPTASLDLKHQHALMKLLRRKASENFCVVAILHDINLAIQYADSVTLLKDGKVIVSGDPREIITSEIMENVFSIRGQMETLVDGSHRFYVLD
ncbi:MAG: heme ABC transporter ATP-binding protein [Pseudomonadota bacterium]